MRVDPHSYFDPEQGIMNYLGFEAKIDFDRKIVKGRATLYFSNRQVDFVDLDTRDLNIKFVKHLRKSFKWEMTEKDPILGSRLRIFLPRHETSVSIQYETSPESTALQWLEPQQTFSNKMPFLYSQCQAIHARSLLPIQDSPGVRFAYDAVINVPSRYFVHMSADPHCTSVRRLGNGRNSWHFKMEIPVPAYLLALLVGNLDRRDLGTRCFVYGEPVEILAEAGREFSDMEKILTTAESILGPYQWDSCAVVVMPPAFPYGGMENPFAIFLNPATVCGDGSKLNTLWHEIAHFWSGNLVTNRTWEDFWLNEGLTTYVERRLVEELECEEIALLHWALGGVDLREALADFKDQPNLTCLHTNLTGVDPDVAFSSVPYEKGSLFFLLLEQLTGRERFDAFLKAYFDNYKFQSIDDKEFIRFLGQELPDVAALANTREWIYKPGLPENAPKINSLKLEYLTSLAENWGNGLSSIPQETANWSPQEWMIYIDKLQNLTPEDCTWFDFTFHLSHMKNQDLLVAWFSKAITSGYAEILPRIRRLLESSGRMGALKELYQALCRAGKKDLAKQWYDECSYLYHPVARAFLEPVLKP